MELERSWEADSFWSSQKIPRIWQNSKVYYHIYKSLRFIPVRSQIHSVRALPTHSLESIIILLFHLLLNSQVVFFFQVSPSKPVCTAFLPRLFHMPRQYPTSLFNQPHIFFLRSSNHDASLYAIFASMLFTGS
jgi:hypothetical protein